MIFSQSQGAVLRLKICNCTVHFTFFNCCLLSIIYSVTYYNAHILTIYRKRITCRMMMLTVNFYRFSSVMGKNKRWVYAKHFQGEPKVSDFELREEEIHPLKEGGTYKHCIK